MAKNKSKRHSQKAGLPPGSLFFLGEQRVDKVTIRVIDYSEHHAHETTVASPDDCMPFIEKQSVTWIDVVGLHETDVLSRFGDLLHIHPLVLEDILNTAHRPHFEDHGESLFCVLKMLYRGNIGDEMVSEQVSLVLGKNFLLTFQEAEGDVFGMIRERIRSAKGRIRRFGCDYLAYSILDAIVDGYFVVLEDVSDRIETLQENILSQPDPSIVQTIHRLKRDMIFMRKNLWPLRELVSELEKSESELVSDALTPYLRDVYDHTFQVIDSVDTSREMLSSALDSYMTSESNRMNEVMKVLTVIATIFIPLTFVAGVYGMNFEHMPELQWRFGYEAVLGVMITIGIGMAIFFKRKRWW